MNSRPILLVEDNADDAFLMERAIKAGGVSNSITHVSDGEEAIAYLDSEPALNETSRPCLMLLDLKLPYKDGFEVLAAVRDHRELRTLAVIVLSSSSQPSDITRALKLGANAYVVKPPAFSDLAKVVVAIRDFWLQYHRPGF